MLSHTKVHIITTLRFSLILVSIQEKNQQENLAKMWSKRKPYTVLVGE
jgi:hypothetical protein